MKTRKICSFLLMLAMLISCMPIITGAQTTLQIGDYLQMGSYYGEPILWRCIDIDENGPLMLSDRIITMKAFDAISGENERNGSHARHERRYWCSNYWGDSNIRSWLNSDAEAGKVEWLCGYPPMAEGGDNYVTCNPYDKEAGFLSNFSETEKSAIKEVTQKLLLSVPEVEAGMAVTGTDYKQPQGIIEDLLKNYDTAYAEYITDKMFCLDDKQVYRIYENREILGKDYHIGKPTAQCIENNEFISKYVPLSVENGWTYWLRSPSWKSPEYVDSIDHYGNGGSGPEADTGQTGVRPAFYIDLQSAELDGGGTNNNPYVVIFSHTHTLVKNEKTDALCTADGIEEHWQCKICNKRFYDNAGKYEVGHIDNITIPAKGHVVKTDTAIAPTCEMNGKTEGKHCVICNAVLIEQTIIPKLNHDWDYWSIVTEPTLTAAGTAERICKNDSSHTETVFLPVLTDTRIWTEGPMSEPSKEFDGAKSYLSDYGTVTLVIPKRSSNFADIFGADNNATPAPDNEFDYEIKYENKQAIITVPLNGIYTVIFASYDTDNRLISINTRKISLVKGKNTVSPDNNFNAEGKIKTMLWESTEKMTPLAIDRG